MIVYLVEDDSLKAERLTSFLNGHFPEMIIKVFGSFQSGLRAVEEMIPELLILDMTIPTFDRGLKKREGRLRPLGGYDLMRKLKLRGIHLNVIIVTQLETFGEGDDKVSFTEISARCKREFPNMFIGSVYFRQGEATWQEELIRLVRVAHIENQ
jgi:DNA-binding response OmpR family regulator